MPSRRLALVAFLVTAAVGLLALALSAITTRSDLVQSLGVAPIYAVAPLHPHGGTVCEDPIALAQPASRISFNVGTHGKPGVALDVLVSRSHGGPIATGHVAPGWIDNGTPQTVAVPTLAPEQDMRICIRNQGPRFAYVFGDLGVPPDGVKIPSGPRPTITPTDGTVDGVGLQGDISLTFHATHKRSLLARVPSMFDHATAYRPGFVGAWTYWLLLAAILIGGPLALGRALVSAAREPSAPPEASAGNGGPAPPPDAATVVRPLPRDEDAAASSHGSRD